MMFNPAISEIGPSRERGSVSQHTDPGTLSLQQVRYVRGVHLQVLRHARLLLGPLSSGPGVGYGNCAIKAHRCFNALNIDGYRSLGPFQSPVFPFNINIEH